MVDPDLLRAIFEQVVSAMASEPGVPIGQAVLHSDGGNPVAIILVVDDPEAARRLAAMLPRLPEQLGIR